ncbi:MAG: hypothetical protein ACXWEZ_13005, partial [Actinomycetota bacterium]
MFVVGGDAQDHGDFHDGLTLIAGSIGLKRFEAIDRRFEAIERSLTGAIDGLRNELKHDIALVDAHVGEVRTELAQ